jgi:hypothetical protein
VKLKARIGAALVAVLVGVGVAGIAASPAYAGSYLHVVRHFSNGWCMEVPYDPNTGTGSMVMGEQLRQGVCGPQTTWYQNFWFEDAGPPHLYFLRPGHNLWCIQPGVPSLQRSTLIQWACTWGDEQKWLLERVAPGSEGFTLMNAASGMCITVEDDSLGQYIRQSFNCAHGLDPLRSTWRLPLPGF